MDSKREWRAARLVEYSAVLLKVCERRLTVLVLGAFFAGLPAVLPLSYSNFVVVFYISLAVAGLCFLIAAILNIPHRRLVLLLLVIPTALFALNSWRIIQTINNQLPEAYEGRDIHVVVTIVSLPQWSIEQGGRKSVSFYGRVSSAHVDGDPITRLEHKTIRLSWFLGLSSRHVKPGQEWGYKVRLKRPRGTVNPSGFDYQAWLLARGISATGYVRRDAKVKFVEQHFSGFNAWRQRLAGQLAQVDAADVKPLLQALLIGDKSAISMAQWQVLQRTGTVHLMAISGLHIGLAAVMGYWFGLLLGHLGALWRPAGIRWLAPLMAIVLAAIYAGLAGFSIPTQRALVMVSVFSVALIFGRKLNYWYVFLVALIAVELLDPFAFIAPGFWLSFLAVAILVYLFGWRRNIDGGVIKTIKSQLWMLVGLLLPLSILGLPVSLVSPVVNLVAVPVLSMVIVPILLLSAFIEPIVPSVAPSLLSIAGTVFEWLWVFMQAAASHGFTRYVITGSGWRTIIAAAIALFTLLSPAGLRLRLLGVSLLVVVVLSKSAYNNDLKITVMDVQQGLAVVIQMPSQTWVYDTGARYSPQFDMGARVVAPYIRSQNIRQIDTLVISHGDNDHAGGAASLVAEFDPPRIFAGELERTKTALINSAASKIAACHAGQQWRVDGAEIEMLWPPLSYTANTTNNLSCVMLITLGGKTALFMGDAEKPVERQLLSSGVLPKKVDILVVGHHGSRTSSSVALVKYLEPKYAVFSAGYRNRYHHPNKKVLRRYKREGAEILRTDLDGALQFELHSQHFEVARSREAGARPWYKPVN